MSSTLTYRRSLSTSICRITHALHNNLTLLHPDDQVCFDEVNMVLFGRFWRILQRSSDFMPLNLRKAHQVMRRRSVTNSLLSAKKRNKLQPQILINQYDTA